MPRTEGWGEQLLIKIVVAGPANVREMVWMRRIQVSAVQIRGPVFPHGGGERDGMSERNGARV